MPKGKKTTTTDSMEEGDLSAADIIAHIKEEYGEDAVRTGIEIHPRSYISTQCAALDYALGIKGVPTSGITNLYGDESSGKSSTSYHILAETQARGGVGILIDTESAWDGERAERIGIVTKDLVRLEPDTLEDGFDEIEDTIRFIRHRDDDRLVCIVYDSVAGGATKASLSGSYADIHPADRARFVSGALPRLHLKSLKNSNVAFILVNQLRDKIEMGPTWGGKKQTQVAENSIKFWSGVRIHFRATSTPITVDGKRDSEPLGIEVVADVKKNKAGGRANTKAQFQIMYWDGINKTESKLVVAIKTGLVAQGGGWYHCEGDRFRGSQWAAYLKEHPDLEPLLAEAPLLWKLEKEKEDGDDS